MTRARTVTILGSTGSIGTQALEIIRAHPQQFSVAGLAASGADASALVAQAIEFGPEVIAVSEAAQLAAVQEGLATSGYTAIEVLAGPSAATELAGGGADVVLNAIAGSVGLRPTLAALTAGSDLALANKESLVAGGPLVRAAVRRPDQIIPVDSEHSAIAQCLRAGAPSEVRRLILTASGGPFRGWSREELSVVTAAQALKHPTWAMGPVVTINSASLMNKGLELIEAQLLFDLPHEQIEVVVHPQSVVHSMVEFQDGSTIAQASPPDMHLPIALGLRWPDRLPNVAQPCAWGQPVSWTFEPVADQTFPAIRLARAAIAAGGTHPAVYNAANEAAVSAFLAQQINFLDIVDTVARVLDEHGSSGTAVFDPISVEAIEQAERWARDRAATLLSVRPT